MRDIQYYADEYELRHIVLQDYIGFFFGDIHSTEMGIKRVSSNNRYVENLLPTIDKTTKVDIRQGTILYRNQIKDKEFNLSFAFDNVTSKQFNLIRSTFFTSEITTMVLDEDPLTLYKIKLKSSPVISYLVFDEGNQRIYKGDCNLSFIIYDLKEGNKSSLDSTLSKIIDVSKSKFYYEKGIPFDIENYEMTYKGIYRNGLGKSLIEQYLSPFFPCTLEPTNQGSFAWEYNNRIGRSIDCLMEKETTIQTNNNVIESDHINRFICCSRIQTTFKFVFDIPTTINIDNNEINKDNINNCYFQVYYQQNTGTKNPGNWSHGDIGWKSYKNNNNQVYWLYQCYGGYEGFWSEFSSNPKAYYKFDKKRYEWNRSHPSKEYNLGKINERQENIVNKTFFEATMSTSISTISFTSSCFCVLSFDYNGERYHYRLPPKSFEIITTG